MLDKRRSCTVAMISDAWSKHNDTGRIFIVVDISIMSPRQSLHFITWSNIYIGSKYPKKIIFNFENKTTRYKYLTLWTSGHNHVTPCVTPSLWKFWRKTVVFQSYGAVSAVTPRIAMAYALLSVGLGKEIHACRVFHGSHPSLPKHQKLLVNPGWDNGTGGFPCRHVLLSMYSA